MARYKKEDLYVNLNLNIRGLSPSSTLTINERSNKLLKEGKTVYKLGLGQSPFPVPDCVVEALKKNAHQKDYLPVHGLYELREAIANFNKRLHKIECTPEDVIIGPGSKELIFILQLVYYGELIIPTPSWVSYSPQARIIGRNVQWVPTSMENNLRLSPEKLELICRSDPNRPRIVILNYPSNPTGCTYPVERLKLLAQVARKYKVILISDEIYGLLHHTNQHVSISRFYPEGTIISSGLSKWCGAGGWRLGCFTFPKNLRWLLNAMATVASETYTSTSAPIQYAAIRAFEGGEEIDGYLHLSRLILRGLARYFIIRFKEMDLEVPVPQGAFYLFPDFYHYKEKLNRKGIYTSVELCEKILEDTGIAMLPGGDFGLQPDDLKTRIAYVDFNGREVLDAMKKNKDNFVDENFINQYCGKLVKAIDLLDEWLLQL